VIDQKALAILVTVGFSLVGILGDYFLKLASASDNSLKTKSFYIGFCPLCFDSFRVGLRHEAFETGDHRRSVLDLDGSAINCDRGALFPRNSQLL
jgi:hypothetical protein